MSVLVPVLDRFARGYPDHVGCPDCGRCKPTSPPLGGNDAVTYGPLSEALTTMFEWDAHFAAYEITGLTRRPTHRALGEYTARMTLLVVDAEPADHKRTPEWDDAEGSKVAKAIEGGAYFYSTRGGYRLIWQLSEPFVITNENDAQRWSASYLNALDEVQTVYGITGDRACKDWTRLYRLPYVLRDGVQSAPETSDNLPGMWQLTIMTVPVKERAALTAVHDDGESAPPELLEHVRARLKSLGPAIAGQGGDQQTFKACALVVRGYALNEEDATTLLGEWNETCEPPWDGDELRTKMDNAYNYGQGDIGEARERWQADTKARAWGERHGAKRPSESEQQTKAKTGGVLAFLAELGPDWTHILAGNIAVAAHAVANPYGALLAQAKAEIEAYNGEASAPQEDERPFFESAEAMFGGTDTPPEWLIKSLVLKGGTVAIGAEPKASKTWLGTELAIALATGTPALGKYDVPKATNVAYFYTEDMRDAIRSRVRSLCAGRGVSTNTLARTFHAQPRGRRIDITRPEDCARIIASVRMIEARSGKVGVLVLDPLRNIHMRDEDKSGEMAAVFEHLKMIGTLLDTTIIIVHHSKKASQNASKRGGQKLRGSSAIHGFLDSALYLSDTAISDDGSTFTNTVESETKSGRSAGVFELTLNIVDDEHTRTAVKATWSIGTKGETTPTEEKVETWEECARECVDAMTQAEARRESLGNAKVIALAIKTKKETVMLALKLAVQRGWLRQDRVTRKYTLAEPGRAMSRERHRVELPPGHEIPTPAPGASAVGAWIAAE